MHAVVDEVAVRLGAVFAAKYFRDGVESLPLESHLCSTGSDWTLNLTEIEDECEVQIDSLVGPLEAGVKVHHWEGDAAPAVVYHHGASEIPYDYGFSRIFHRRDSRTRQVSLLALRAPWHASRSDFARGSSTLENWMAMLSVSVTLAEKAVSALRQQGVRRVAVCGTSLGGFVTNLHHIHCDSADVYLPLLAGLAMDEAYLESAYSCAVAPLTREERTVIRRVLNFEEGFRNRNHDHVFPLLARHDRLLTFERQRESYGDCDVQVIDKGHATGALAYGELRDHIFQHLNA